MSQRKFDIVEIRLGSLAGWWVRNEEDRLELIKHARGLGEEFSMLVEERNAIRVCVSDAEFDYLKRLSGTEEVLAQNLPDGIGMVCITPAEWRDEEGAMS